MPLLGDLLQTLVPALLAPLGVWVGYRHAKRKYSGRGSVTINQTTPRSERPLPRPPGWSGR